MNYRNIGNTGISASIIGLGAEHLDNKPYPVVEETIHAALDEGINMIDVFMPGKDVRTNIGKALGNRRKDVIIQGHIGSVDLNQQYDISRDLSTCKKYFEDLLQYLGTDYIDFGMLFFMDSEEALSEIHDNGIIDYVLDLKQKGIIRAIGASSHNPDIARKVVETGLIDLLMFSINPAFDMTPSEKYVLSTLDDQAFPNQQYISIDPVRAELYKLCEKKGVGITVMKTLGGGRLLSAEHSPFKKPMSVAQCIHYALTRPAVVCTLIGCQSRQQVSEAVNYLKIPDDQKDYTDILKEYEGNFKGNCVYCNHCQPCPSKIDIAVVNKYLDIVSTDEKHVPPSIKQHYDSLRSHGSDCTACGSCEEKCPFYVPVISRMEKAMEIFGY